MPKRLLLVLTLSLAACSSKARETTVPDLPGIEANLAFSCSHEQARHPTLSPDVESLYRYGRYLQKTNILKEDPDIYPEQERLFRIATAHGHYKANLALRQMIGEGKAGSDDPVKEILNLTEILIQQGIPGAYYDMGHYLEVGYGVKQDSVLALKYFRKAADLGNPEGQYLVATKIAPIDIAPTIAQQMRNCAAQQGHGKAALALALSLQDYDHAESVRIFYLGIKAGDSTCSYALEEGFKTSDTNSTFFLSLAIDEERSRRYKAIGKILSDWSYLHPTVPDLDDIVPLPPAPLPPWDGSIQWLRDQQANVAPPQPDEALLQRLAAARGLDARTGLPLPAPPAPKPDLPPVSLGHTCRSGEPCPQGGRWQVQWPQDPDVLPSSCTRYFNKGEILPLCPIMRREHGEARLWRSAQPTADEAVIWQLMSHA